MRIHRLSMVLAVVLSAPLLSAQTSAAGVQDVGLTIQTPGSTAVSGQACGPFRCRPLAAPNVSVSSAASRTRIVTVHGAPGSLYVLAIGAGSLATPCQTIPGIGNALILGLPASTLQFGITSAGPSSSLACRQGSGQFVLDLPATSPLGFRFLLQAVTTSATTGSPAFTIAIESRTF